MTDLWSSEDTNPIVACCDIGFFTAYTGGCTEGAPVKLQASSTDGVIYCLDGTAIGDSFMLALKDADAGDMVPCAVFGVVKVVADQTASVVTGEIVMNSAAGGVIDQAVGAFTQMEIFGGSSYAFGVALQSSSAADDEILVLLGKTF